MQAAELLGVLQARRIALSVAPDGIRYEAPWGAMTPDLRATIAKNKEELRAVLVCRRVESKWKPGERIAYREAGVLVTAKYAGVATTDAVNVWLADGATRAIAAHAVALDWLPDEADIFEERLSVMLNAGVPEDVARIRAADCTREYLARVEGSNGSKERNWP